MPDEIADKSPPQSDDQPVQRQDIFFFHNFNFDVPTDYYKQLGDFNAVSPVQI